MGVLIAGIFQELTWATTGMTPSHSEPPEDTDGGIEAAGEINIGHTVAFLISMLIFVEVVRVSPQQFFVL